MKVQCSDIDLEDLAEISFTPENDLDEKVLEIINRRTNFRGEYKLNKYRSQGSFILDLHYQRG